MSGSKHKNSGDVAGTAKKHQVITMETEVKTIERVEQGEKMVDVVRSYNMNRSTIGPILKNKDKITEREVCCADEVDNNTENVDKKKTVIWKKKNDGGDGETSQCVDAGSASASSPTQLNADSRES
ncbi:hypothetical protein J1605_020761 [Eschrichtius robustus]|uniref:HTH psq-type domain-containing protein n=1 Tax=Eschrichtius robustus TaxID=9764 RepID=A0AB34HGG5_ESCRO|nr:hypothetical protein J1605_020761 [Eschrichtius robustus]